MYMTVNYLNKICYIDFIHQERTSSLITDIMTFYVHKKIKTGSPDPKVTWYHHSKLLDTHEQCSTYFQNGYHYLKVTEPTFLDGQKIVCKADNEIGFVDCLISLQAEGKY